MQVLRVIFAVMGPAVSERYPSAGAFVLHTAQSFFLALGVCFYFL